MTTNGGGTETFSEVKREANEIIMRMPERHCPPFLRLGIRLLNGVPIAKAEALFRIEVAKADYHVAHGGGE